MPAVSAKLIREWFPDVDEEDSKALAAIVRDGGVDDALETFDKTLRAHGIEAVRGDYHVDNYFSDIVALYVNTGDIYNATLLYETEEQRFLLTTLGDWLEKNQSKYRIM